MDVSNLVMTMTQSTKSTAPIKPIKLLQRLAAVAVLALVLPLMSGCPAVGLMAYALEEAAPPVKVLAETHVLDNQTTAVLVDASLGILYQNPLVQLEVGEAVTRLLAAGVPGIKVIDAKQIVDFQQRNIYWNTVSYSDLMKHLGATRLVMIEIIDYRLHEPGNVNIWRGLLSGNITVAGSDGPRPNDLLYASTVTAAYPPDQTIGVVNANQQTIRLGTLDLFARAVAGKFHDHTVERTK
jgi:hypothetical protein